MDIKRERLFSTRNKYTAFLELKNKNWAEVKFRWIRHLTDNHFDIIFERFDLLILDLVEEELKILIEGYSFIYKYALLKARVKMTFKRKREDNISEDDYENKIYSYKEEFLSIISSLDVYFEK